MKKIPTLFKRDFENDPQFLTDEPVSDWVIKAVQSDAPRATAKFDGTSVMVVWSSQMYRRYTHRSGQGDPPSLFVPSQQPRENGKQPGWVPCEPSDPNDQYHFEALENEPESGGLPPGTYELVGPKVQGNPHGFDEHQLIRHGSVPIEQNAEGFENLLESISYEGVVWWMEGRPIAKLKRRDFGLDWPIEED